MYEVLKIPGMLMRMPSSPPVNPLNFVAKMMANSAMAKVTIAKKIAFTLSDRKLINMAIAMEITISDDKAEEKIQITRTAILPHKHGHTVGTDTEKHDVTETENSGVAEKDVEAGHQHGKDHDF